MAQLNYSRIARASVLGAAAGLVSFVVQEPRTRALEASGRMGHADGAFAEAALMFSVLGLLISTALVLVDEISSISAKRVLVLCGIALVAGATCGAVAGLIGQAVFSFLGLGVRGLDTLVVARAMGWGAVGAGIGFGAGLPSLSVRKCLQGVLGGLIGGAVGGLVFDLASLPFEAGTISRLIGDLAIGACVGAAVVLVEEAAKVAWVTVVLGRNEGRQHILSKPATTIGRDELADIPLYGDRNVARRHGLIRTHDWRVFTYADLGSPAGSGINGVRVAEKPLLDGDRIQIGGFQLMFSHRSGAAPVYQPRQIAPPPQVYQAQNPSLCPFCGQPRDPVTGTCACVPIATSPGAPVIGPAALLGVAGPYKSATFQLDRDRVEIGRDPSNGIVLEQDPGVSRKHAAITKQGGSYLLQDLGSTNGTYVNGVRVQSASLNVGDVVHFGGSSFRFGN